MDTNFRNEPNELSKDAKRLIIDLVCQEYAKGNLEQIRTKFKFQKGEETEAEFVDELYDVLKDMPIEQGLDRITLQKKLKRELYAYFQINTELPQEDRTAEVTESTVIKEKSDSKQEVRYKPGLYQPEVMCSHPRDKSGKPFVELVRNQERDNFSETYQFEDRTYTITEIGKLNYMFNPVIQQKISEYSITISKGNISKTIRVFGEILFYEMTNPNYRENIFTQLLGVQNLIDRELHGYIGRLDYVYDDKGKRKEEYKIVYQPEEYTAVVMWKEKEKEKKEKSEKQENFAAREYKMEDKASGGDER